MEVRQYMTPEGLLEFEFHDGVLVCVEEINGPTTVEKTTHWKVSCPQLPPPQSCKPSATDDLLRLPTHRVVRAPCVSCKKRS